MSIRRGSGSGYLFCAVALGCGKFPICCVLGFLLFFPPEMLTNSNCVSAPTVAISMTFQIDRCELAQPAGADDFFTYGDWVNDANRVAQPVVSSARQNDPW